MGELLFWFYIGVAAGIAIRGWFFTKHEFDPYSDPQVGVFWVAILWPFVLVIFLIATLSERLDKRKKCPKCGSHNTVEGHYTRSWNKMCEQAAGDQGIFCRRCSNVSFFTSAEEYNKNKQSWVTEAKD